MKRDASGTLSVDGCYQKIFVSLTGNFRELHVDWFRSVVSLASSDYEEPMLHVWSQLVVIIIQRSKIIYDPSFLKLPVTMIQSNLDCPDLDLFRTF